MSCDLHRHDMFSRYDGYGRPSELAKLAKELGHTALGTSNHGNTNGLVQTYKACKENGIKPILGVEGYFLPVYKEKERGYHLCLFAKNLEGYKNLNAIQSEGEKQKYYNPIWTFKLLEKYHDGIICTSACVASYSSQCIINDDEEKAEKYLRKMHKIFGDDFYIEIQPYTVSEKGLQERVNASLLSLSVKLGIPCILTSDSHRGRFNELQTYLKMHEMDGHNMEEIESTYKERYMPAPFEMEKRFIEMHKNDYGEARCKRLAQKMAFNMEQLEEKVDADILGKLELKLPKIAGNDSNKEIIKQIKDGLKARGQYTKPYIDRCKEELDVIRENGFVDYFLIVADYVTWAKRQGIAVGAGRGSVCNCLVAYAMGITEVDSLRFNLDFRRFMRYDKKQFPDIDIDFETSRRQEVIDYLINKYPTQSARVSAYGLFSVDNTINELAKVCGLPTDKNVDDSDAKINKQIIAEIKKFVNSYKDAEEGTLDLDGVENAPQAKQFDRQYDNIITHFCRLYGKVNYIGTHAAGVVVTSGDVLQYTAIRLDKDGNKYSVYNLEDLNDINIIKFDLLGLKTMMSLGECRRLTGVDFNTDIVEDAEVLAEFKRGNTCGIFQVEKDTCKKMLAAMHCDNFDDIVATSSMNRPAPLKQGIPEIYAKNKLNGYDTNGDLCAPYTGETYGTMLYQEQVLLVCVNVGGLEWVEADAVLKAAKHGREKFAKGLEKYKKENGVDLEKKFFANARKNGMSKERLYELWESMKEYGFNKGHAVGYTLITVEEMFFKHYYPVEFWYTKLKYARDDKQRNEFNGEAVKDGCLLFLPHVNYSHPLTRLRTVEGERILQQGLTDIKGVGEKAALAILQERERNGYFKNFDDFYDRCVETKLINKKVYELLSDYGAIEFKKSRYIDRIKKYNSALYARSMRE